MLFSRYNAHLWTVGGNFSKALSKGANTTWLWNIHASAHDYESHNGTSNVVARKVFSSNMAHISIVFLWLSGMHWHGAYFSNYNSWIIDPMHNTPSAQLVWSIVSQDIINGFNGSYFSGISITSGFFHLWLSEGITNQLQLRSASFICLTASLITLVSSYWHQGRTSHISWFFRKLTSITYHHILILVGLASIAWSGHEYHISIPINILLSNSIHGATLDTINADSLLSSPIIIRSIYPAFGKLEPTLTSSCSALMLIADHHLAVGVTSILAGIAALMSSQNNKQTSIYRSSSHNNQSVWHAQLAINLSVTGSMSIFYAYMILIYQPYEYLQYSYVTELSLICHHLWIGGIFILGSGAHASIYIIQSTSVSIFLRQREIIVGHLSFVSIWLGFHSFGMYVHNDTMQALMRLVDTFNDNSINLRPILAIKLSTLIATVTGYHSTAIDGKLSTTYLELGTSDFLVGHIHAFTIHVTLLILIKGILFSRTSRLVQDKLQLGFAYPCDGPGRGGTCQVSPWDHIYLSSLWVYNSVSIIIFNIHWHLQSDVWGSVSSSSGITHLLGGNFSQAVSINSWLRDLLWSQASQVIQSYGSDQISAYGFIFIASHFIWSFSLMFLFSGRGYWQELIESISWSHCKLKVIPSIAPRALSISHGRLVGATHFILGGIGTIWSFVVALSLIHI